MDNFPPVWELFKDQGEQAGRAEKEGTRLSFGHGSPRGSDADLAEVAQRHDGAVRRRGRRQRRELGRNVENERVATHREDGELPFFE